MVRFDRAAPGEGMIIYSRLENGKAYLEFQFFLKIGESSSPRMLKEYFAHICVTDAQGIPVLEIEYPLAEEEPAKGLLLYPHLWEGGADPYLYQVRVCLWNCPCDNQLKNIPIDSLEKILPLRSIKMLPGKGCFLNGNKQELRPVIYQLPGRRANDISGLEQMRQELFCLKEMGANTICVNNNDFREDFLKICEEAGLLVWYVDRGDMLPEVKDLLGAGGDTPTDLYYLYKARWSNIPFVYPVRKSLVRQRNGNYSLKIYTNQKRAVLYVEGVLFEMKSGDCEYLFEEIPAKKYPLQLTAEAGDCRVSLTLYR